MTPEREREEQYIHDNMVLEVEVQHLKSVNRQLGMLGIMFAVGLIICLVLLRFISIDFDKCQKQLDRYQHEHFSKN